MNNPALFWALYLLDLLSTLYLAATIARESRRMKVAFSFSNLIIFAKEEFRRLKKGVVPFFHLSIVGGVAITIIATVLYPLILLSLYALYFVIALIIILSIGLSAALVWRIWMLGKSEKVHEELGAELRIDERFRKESFHFHILLITVILLTIINLDLLALPYENFFYYASITFIVRTIMVAYLYAKPAVNSFKNIGMKISEITTPFNIKEVMEGKLDPSSIRIGAGMFSDLEQFELNSLDACVEIGACEAACPATRVYRPLSPRVLVRKLAIAKMGNYEQPLQQVISEEELWACTTCMACVYSCPVDVKHVPIIIDMRRELVEQGRLDKKKSSLLLSLNEYGNTFSTPNQGRNEWLKEVGINHASAIGDVEYLFWVGCMGSFDPRIKKYVGEFAYILKKAGISVKVAILGDEEACCGDPARRLGEESKFQELALMNIEKFKKYNVKKIVLICPHGFNTFKNEYTKLDEWMKSVEILHYTELIERMISDGSINLSRGQESYVPHDPCYLARYNGVVNAPRDILRKIGEIKEAELHGEDTFCCGAGGSNYWYEVKERKRISHERVEQLVKTEGRNIVTMCPFCNAMLYDALNTLDLVKKVYLKDIAEVVKEKIV